jgi:hypothetical protein
MKSEKLHPASKRGGIFLLIKENKKPNALGFGLKNQVRFIFN